MQVTELLDKLPRTVLLTIGFLMVPVLGMVEYVGGPYLSFPIFYLLPITIVSWSAGWGWGATICIASTVTMVVSGMSYKHPEPVFVLWNSAVRAMVFLFMSYMLAALRVSLQKEKEMARRDVLTGIANRRLFIEVATAEIHRARRYGHPFTLAYVDVDDFKSVNDAAGHAAGDTLLKALCVRIEANIRQADTLARMGGDEFAILFPEIGYEAAGLIAQRIEQRLKTAFEIHGKPVTFSIGVVTFDTPPADVDQMIKAADELMYSVKSSGKNRLLRDVRNLSAPLPSMDG
jgi:diguanylate cyclase (GGDEF)-like protein